jgi:uncharacterized protein (DUF1499 family)
MSGLFTGRPKALGAEDGRLAPCPDTPNCLSSQAEDAGHRVDPLRFAVAPERAWRAAVDAVSSLPRAQLVTLQEGYLHAECTSALFRFVDDVELLLDAAGRQIHVRSASRLGRSDLGANRRRLRALRAAFAMRLALP